MARRRPSTAAEFLGVKGVGDWKAGEFGPRFLAAIRAYVESAPG
jgi:superfamily II DNA helicase RecQ